MSDVWLNHMLGQFSNCEAAINSTATSSILHGSHVTSIERRSEQLVAVLSQFELFVVVHGCTRWFSRQRYVVPFGHFLDVLLLPELDLFVFAGGIGGSNYPNPITIPPNISFFEQGV